MTRWMAGSDRLLCLELGIVSDFDIPVSGFGWRRQPIGEI